MLDDALHQYFGFREFRPGQRDIAESVCSGRDTLVIMPTGGGKSLCYQLPALVLEGVAIVVSPLIALMKDQVDALEQRGIPVTFINSTLKPAEQAARIDAMAAGEYKLVYIAPERFRHKHFVNRLRKSKISFVAIDEAHCVSMWGHDFRPDYLRVGEALEQFGQPPVSAFTATATPIVRDDIAKSLRLRDPRVFVTGFGRPNLSFSVRNVRKRAEKFARIADLVEKHKTGIVYCATRKRVEEVATQLTEWEISHVAYHAGLSDEEREDAQNRFLQKKADVAVATNAFGMGIDRADIRFVVHIEFPGSVEAYYQEAGRAGRDGQDSICEILYNFADKATQEFFLEGSNPEISFIHRLYTELQQIAGASGDVSLSIRDLTDMLGSGTNGMAVSSALSVLNRAGVVERYDIPGQRIRGTRLLKPEVPARELPIDTQLLKEKKARDYAKLDAMLSYCTTARCRQDWILDYFGEKHSTNCGNCDICLPMIPSDARPGNEEEVLIVRKALSGIARCSRRDNAGRYHARFGRGKILLHLIGSRSEQITQSGLDKLTTYGILKQPGKDYLGPLFNELQRAGLLAVDEREGFRLTTLSERGVAVMLGKQACPPLLWPEGDNHKLRGLQQIDVTTSKPARLRLSSEDDFDKRRQENSSHPVSRSAGNGKSKRASPEGVGVDDTAAGTSSSDAELLTKLKNKRLQLAIASKRKPFQIFSNAVLEEMARRKPLTLEEAFECKGIGETNGKKWFKHFQPIIVES